MSGKENKIGGICEGGLTDTVLRCTPLRKENNKEGGIVAEKRG